MALLIGISRPPNNETLLAWPSPPLQLSYAPGTCPPRRRTLRAPLFGLSVRSRALAEAKRERGPQWRVHGTRVLSAAPSTREAQGVGVTARRDYVAEQGSRQSAGRAG